MVRTPATIEQGITPGILRARLLLYALIGVLATGAALLDPHPRQMALLAVLTGGVAMPLAFPGRQRLYPALVADTLVAAGVWWLIGPSAGPDFMLLVVGAVAALAFRHPKSTRLVGLVVLAEISQLPLHFAAKYGTQPPLFHPPGQVVGDAEFAVGVLGRAAIIVATAVLFGRVGNDMRGSQAALAASESTFRAAFQDAPTGVMLLAQTGEVLRSNQEAALLASNAAPGRVEQLFGGRSRARVGSLVGEVLAGGRPRASLGPLPARDGKWLRLTVSCIEGSSDGPAGVVTLEDMTRQIEDNQRLEELLRSKDEFVASVSHELRTPLTAVLGFAEVLREAWDELADAERESLIADIGRESGVVASLVDDMLVIARADTGALALVPEDADLSHLVRGIVEDLDDPQRERVEVDVPSIVLRADGHRLAQVVRNLIDNAVAHGGERVEVSAGRDGDRVTLWVCDDGDGVPGDVERVFNPYETAHDSPTKPSGTGLGLAVGRSLARAMGGDLIYERVAGWTRFSLVLPVLAPGSDSGETSSALRTRPRPPEDDRRRGHPGGHQRRDRGRASAGMAPLEP